MSADQNMLQTDELVEAARALSASQISDALAELGLPSHSMDGILTLDLAAKVVGRAFTVTCLPAAESEGKRIEYLGDIPAGAVVVISNGGRTDCSVWGGQRTLAARQRGAVGSIVDGAFRDVPEHIALSYPVFARKPVVVGSRGYANPVHTQEPVVMSNLTVHPGDLIVGDASGVVVVPADRAPEVIGIATREAAAESRIAAAVAAGMDFFEAKTLAAQ
ncbi:MAG: diguanylate cyclase [Rhodoglobus sp.]|nr:diguanylate cyclase [Rhodoglobus sp.]